MALLQPGVRAGPCEAALSADPAAHRRRARASGAARVSLCRCPAGREARGVTRTSPGGWGFLAEFLHGPRAAGQGPGFRPLSQMLSVEPTLHADHGPVGSWTDTPHHALVLKDTEEAASVACVPAGRSR